MELQRVECIRIGCGIISDWIFSGQFTYVENVCRHVAYQTRNQGVSVSHWRDHWQRSASTLCKYVFCRVCKCVCVCAHFCACMCESKKGKNVWIERVFDQYKQNKLLGSSTGFLIPISMYSKPVKRWVCVKAYHFHAHWAGDEPQTPTQCSIRWVSVHLTVVLYGP